MDKFRAEEIEKAKIAKFHFDNNSWVTFSNAQLYTEAYRRLEAYGLITLVGKSARLGPLGIDELNIFIKTGKTKEERNLIEEKHKNDKFEKREKLKIFREWVTLIISGISLVFSIIAIYRTK